ncbi:hypothetical protein ACOMHN_042127 [Nucella lapillus]
MMDSELKKSSIRANKLEKKRFEMMMSAFDTAKRNVAVDMKKSQLDFKRRLKRYKDRQREILVTRSEPSSTSMEEFVLKQLTRRNQSHTHPPQYASRRPHTCPHPPKGGTSSGTSSSGESGLGGGHRVSRTAAGGGGVVGNLGGSTDLEEEEEVEDFAKLSHCRRSKVDLRPCTAWSAVRTSCARADSITSTRINPSGSLKLLQLRGGSLGTPGKQVRYFNDEEIEERGTFYRFLLDGFRHIEHQRLEALNDRVEDFCGKGSGRQQSCPPLRRTGVVSLPPAVPPIILQAMKVKIPHANLLAQLPRSRT